MTRTVHVIGNVQMDVLASPVRSMPLPGGDDIIDSIAVRPAGAAGNVSLALAALGVPHRLFGAVGDDQAGLWVADELRRLGLGDDLQVVKGHETGISIALEAPDRERAFLTAHGVLNAYGEESVPPGTSTPAWPGRRSRGCAPGAPAMSASGTTCKAAPARCWTCRRTRWSRCW